MRQLDQNKQKMYYSQPKSIKIIDSDGHILINNEKDEIIYDDLSGVEPTEDIFVRDENGNIIYTNVDGVDYPVLSETINFYDSPTIFYANISFDSGETQPAEYGLDTSGYNAIISANKGELPFTEETLIWHKSQPSVDERGRALPETADYRIVAIKTSLNEERFFLKKRVDD